MRPGLAFERYSFKMKLSHEGRVDCFRWGHGIARLIRVCLSFCGLGFKSQAHPLFLPFIVKLYIIFVIVLRKDKNKQKEVILAHFQKDFILSKSFQRNVLNWHVRFSLEHQRQ